MKRIAPFVFIAFAAFGLLGTPSTAFSQALPVVWDHTYGGAEYDGASSIVALVDGGFAVAGYTDKAMWVLRLDEAGNVVWDHTYDGSESDGASSIVALADGGFAVAGYTRSKGAGSSDMWVLRLDEVGNVVWDHTYGRWGMDGADSIVTLADGGFAVAGHTSSKGAGNFDIWVLRLDEAGNVVWDQTYGGAEGDFANSIVALADGGFAVAGQTKSKGAGGNDMWVLRLDEAGNVVWDHTYGGSESDGARSIVALADGGFAVAGNTYSKGAGKGDVWVLRLDEAGNVVWDHAYGSAGSDSAYSIVALADGGLAVGSNTQSKGAGEEDVWVLRLDEAGNVVWDQTYGGAQWDSAHSIVALADGGFAVAGNTHSKGAGGNDMWVLRLDEAGNTAFAQALPMVNDTAIPLMVPNAGQILMSFPICRFRSSWGPRCPDSEAEINAVRLFSGLGVDPRIEKIGLNADNAFIETDDWYYIIDSVKENDLGFTFHFTDDSKCCSYSTAEKFYAERDKVSLGWVIVGTELTYISGPDQQGIGKYISFDIPVPLRVDE